MQYRINPDIRKAETLPSGFYKDPQIFDELKEKVFLQSWQLVDGFHSLKKGSVFPFSMLGGFLDEPLVLTRDQQGKIHCLSNVCTHRGNLIIEQEKSCKNLVCRYHGRKFDLDGKFNFMPEFQNSEGFPRKEDDLKSFLTEEWGPMVFAALEPSIDLITILKRIEDRLGFLPLQDMVFRPLLSKKYTFKANWALYCDNFLEGFHIPYVHKSLNEILDYRSYEIELEENFNLQIGIAKEGEECFDFPEDHADHKRKIAAYYYWIFPNLMLNFYPWGLSANIVKPKKIDETEVVFLSYVFDDSKLNSGAGSCLDKVEMEDEGIVESVQKGIVSRYYKTGRFSPDREQGVHHFHQLLTHYLAR
jgi:phenylpropionate dioxygenase-like ring-hydroxylating dioxygenase large terminal subunit